MSCKKVYILPCVLCSWFIITFILLYILAVYSDDVEPVFPYISDTGTKVPQSCIFGQLLSVGSILLAIIIYIQYIHIREVQIKHEREKYRSENTVCLFLGWSASFGISIVANFQETNMFLVHIVGAIMAFGLGSVYQIIMWKVSNELHEDVKGRKWVLNCRLVLAIISLVTFLCCFGFAGVALQEFHGEDVTKWTRKDGGYDWHLASTSTEWICAMTTMLYILTFWEDFRYIQIDEPQIHITARP